MLESILEVKSALPAADQKKIKKKRYGGKDFEKLYLFVAEREKKDSTSYFIDQSEHNKVDPFYKPGSHNIRKVWSCLCTLLSGLAPKDARIENYYEGFVAKLNQMVLADDIWDRLASYLIKNGQFYSENNNYAKKALNFLLNNSDLKPFIKNNHSILRRILVLLEAHEEKLKEFDARISHLLSEDFVQEQKNQQAVLQASVVSPLGVTENKQIKEIEKQKAELEKNLHKVQQELADLELQFRCIDHQLERGDLLQGSALRKQWEVVGRFAKSQEIFVKLRISQEQQAQQEKELEKLLDQFIEERAQALQLIQKALLEKADLEELLQQKVQELRIVEAQLSVMQNALKALPADVPRPVLASKVLSVPQLSQISPPQAPLVLQIPQTPPRGLLVSQTLQAPPAQLQVFQILQTPLPPVSQAALVLPVTQPSQTPPAPQTPPIPQAGQLQRASGASAFLSPKELKLKKREQEAASILTLMSSEARSKKRKRKEEAERRLQNR